MRIKFFTRQPELFSLFSERLEALGHSLESISSQKEFIHHIIDSEESARTGLLVCDYSAFCHEELNVFGLLISCKRQIPLVFYNDPYPSDEERVAFWRSQNQQYLEIRDFSSLGQIFEELSQIAIRNKDHIALLCPPRPMRRRPIPPETQRLLACLSGGAPVSTGQLAQAIGASPDNAQAVYTAVCRARKHLLQDGRQILRCAKGEYVLKED